MLFISFNALAEQANTQKTNQASAINAITQAAIQKGISNCAARINQVTNFLGFGPQAGALLMAPASLADQRIVPITMEVPTPNGSAYVSSSFSPSQASGCSATYDAVVYWQDKCETVAAKSFTNMKSIGKLKSNVVVLDGGVNVKVFLMPAGSGCVSIKKELIMDK